MRYADSRCTYQEQYKPIHAYVYTGNCVKTGKQVTVTIPAQELFAYRQGVNIQTALKSLSPADREFLMSGISDEGWEEIFSSKEKV